MNGVGPAENAKRESSLADIAKPFKKIGQHIFERFMKHDQYSHTDMLDDNILRKTLDRYLEIFNIF